MRGEPPKADDAKPKRVEVPGRQRLRCPKKVIIEPASSPRKGDEPSRPRNNRRAAQKPKNLPPRDNRRSRPLGDRRKHRPPSATRKRGRFAEKENAHPLFAKKTKDAHCDKGKMAPRPSRRQKSPTVHPLWPRTHRAKSEGFSLDDVRGNSERTQLEGRNSLISPWTSTPEMLNYLRKPDTRPRTASEKCRIRPGNTT